ncbi:hypothetical protein BDK51DRAFT_46203, partial [Blyttiomyces helicus]
ALEDHFRLLKSVVNQLQDQITAVSSCVEDTRLHGEEHARFADQIRRRGDADRTALATLATEITNIHHEVTALREAITTLSADLLTTTRDSQEASAWARRELLASRDEVHRMDARIGASLQTADRNLVATAKLLNDQTAAARLEAERARAELAARIDQGAARAREGDAAVFDVVRDRCDSLLGMIEEELAAAAGREKAAFATMEERIAALDDRVRAAFEAQERVRVKAAADIVDAFGDIRDEVAALRRDEDALRADLGQTGEVLRKEIEESKGEVQMEIRRMTRPLIVIILAVSTTRLLCTLSASPNLSYNVDRCASCAGSRNELLGTGTGTVNAIGSMVGDMERGSATTQE